MQRTPPDYTYVNVHSLACDRVPLFFVPALDLEKYDSSIVWQVQLQTIFISPFTDTTADDKMHLGLIDLIKGFLTRGEGIQQALSDGKSDNYYFRGNIQDRGPCPALNALANQGYL